MVALGADRVVFVSSNKGDFAEEKAQPPTLHRDLVEDLAGLPAPATGTLCLRVQDVLDLPELASLVAGLRTTARTPPVPATRETADGAVDAADDLDPPAMNTTALLADAVQAAADDLSGTVLENRHDDFASEFAAGLLPYWVDEATVDEVMPVPGSVDWQGYDSYEGGTVLLQVTAHAQIAFTGYARKADVAPLDPTEVTVLDWDWNDHMAEVAFSRPARLTFQARLNTDSEQLEDALEFESAEPLD